MTEILPAHPDLDLALVREIAMDIGKAAVEHLEIMYPAALAAVPKTARLSLRNCIHNEIMAALETIDADAIRARLDERKAARRSSLAQWRKMRSET